MIAYNKSKLENTFLKEEAEILFEKRFIEKKDFDEIKSQLPSLNTNPIIIRLGFFLLGCFLASSCWGVITMIVLTGSSPKPWISFFLSGIFALIACELLSQEGYYKHGLNDAFILSAIAFIPTATSEITESSTLAIIAVIITGLWCSVRYVHTASAIVTFLGCVALVCDLVITHHLIDESLLPFIGLFLGLVFYFSNKKVSKNESFEFYRNSFLAIKICSLILICLSMNYMVVRELSEILLKIKVIDDIPFAWLFYLTTFAIPMLYIVVGIRKKEREFLNLGILAAGFAVYSTVIHYEIMAIELVLSLGGVLLFTIAFLAFHRLKNKTIGLTFQPNRGADGNFIQNAQAILAVLESEKPQPCVAESDMPFGGGAFSGGGAGSEY